MPGDSGTTTGEGHTPGWTTGQALRAQEGLWQELLLMADEVEVALRTSVTSLCEQRPELVRKIVAHEAAIDDWEVRIESECLRVLALFGLVASDLRRVVAALRINRDLEGLADIAENIAKRAVKLEKDETAAPFLEQLRPLADEALGVVDLGLAALRTIDSQLARQTIEADRAVDALRSTLIADLKTEIRLEPEKTKTWLRLLSSARNLARAADHATNIAESVVYVKEGVNMRRGDDDNFDD